MTQDQMPTSSLTQDKDGPLGDTGISPYEMLYGLSYLGQPSNLPSFESKDQFLQNYVLGLSSAPSPLGNRYSRPRLHRSNFQHIHTDWEIMSWCRLGVKRSSNHPGGTLAGATHYQDSSMYCWERMDTLHPNKMISQGGKLDRPCFQVPVTQNNLKETVIELLFFFHLGNWLLSVLLISLPLYLLNLIFAL
jgi:hypothetical protein